MAYNTYMLAFAKFYGPNIMHIFQRIEQAARRARVGTLRNWAHTDVIREDYEAACKRYERALALEPSNAELYASRGYVRFKLGRHADAIVDFDRALGLDPNLARAYVDRGMAYFALGQVAEAICDYNMAIYIEPTLAAAYNNRALADEAQGNLSGALVDYTHAIHADPDYRIAYRNRGYARIDWGDLRGALADFQRYLLLGSGQSDSNRTEVEASIASIRRQLQGQ